MKIRYYRFFSKIESVLPQINGDRKLKINIKFILNRIFKMMKLQFKNMPIPKSEKNISIL